MRDYRAMGDEVRSLVQALVDALERAVTEPAGGLARSRPPGPPHCAPSPAAWPAGRRSAGASPKPSRVGPCRGGRRGGGGRAGRARGSTWEGAIVVWGWAAASALGLYLGVPETDHVVGVAAVLAVLVLTAVAPRRKPAGCWWPVSCSYRCGRRSGAPPVADLALVAGLGNAGPPRGRPH